MNRCLIIEAYSSLQKFFLENRLTYSVTGKLLNNSEVDCQVLIRKSRSIFVFPYPYISYQNECFVVF